jgi:hypothetical protein
MKIKVEIEIDTERGDDEEIVLRLMELLEKLKYGGKGV